MTGGTKVVFIGVDAGDKDLILHWAEAGALPTFRSLLRRGLRGVTRNPPGLFVGAIWPSFYTGVSPAKHGRYCYLQLKPGTYDFYSTHTPNFVKREPFWNALSRAGRKVAILDVPHTFPGPLNGIQLVEWGAHDATHGLMSWPASLAREVEHRFGTHPVPARCNAERGPMELRILRQQLVTGVSKKADLTGHFLQREDWDFFAAVFSETHCVGHQCWHLHDETHPRYNEEVAGFVGDPVKDVYMAIDSAIGHLLTQIGPKTTAIILCSHGMGPHYDGTFLLDDILRGLENANAMKEQSDLASRKCFPIPNNEVSGAIRINRVGREPNGIIPPGPQYEEFCATLTRDLLDLVNPDTDEPLVREVFRAVDRYDGGYIDHLPDLIVEWNRAKPISSAYSPKFGVMRMEYRGRRSGDHKPEGMFIALGPSIQPGHLERLVSVTDFAPTIASLLDVLLPGVDGKPIEELL